MRAASPNRVAGLDDRIAPVLGQAERLPFDDGAFDAVSFTYLLRYVDDPAATVRELTRVIATGGSIAMLEFHVPRSPVARAGWWIYTRVLMRVLGTAASPAWARTVAFLGPDISRFVEQPPAGGVGRLVPASGHPSRSHPHLPVRVGRRAVGREGRMSEDRPAFYALAPGGWRDWWTLLHPPYTLWHLSYVALGAATTVTSSISIGSA